MFTERFTLDEAGTTTRRNDHRFRDPTFEYRYFGWGLSSTSKEMNERRSSAEQVTSLTSDTEKIKEIQATCVEVQSSLGVLCAQDIYLSFLSILVRRIDGIGGETIVSHLAPWKTAFLKNFRLEEVVRAFAENGLGTSSDAFCCIIPLLMTQSKLPKKYLNMVSVERQLSEKPSDIDGWLLVAETVGQVRDSARGEDFVRWTINLGELYHAAMRSTNRWIKGHGFHGVSQMIVSGEGASQEIQDIQHQFGWIAMRIAEEYKEEGMISKLRKSGVNGDSLNYDESQPIEYWVARGATATTRYLIRKHDLQLPEFQTLLGFAAESGQDATVRLFLEKEVDVNQVDTSGMTPLLRALENQHATTAHLLIEYGADYEGKNPSTWAELDWASRHDHQCLVELLVEKLLEVGAQDSQSCSILTWAIGHSHVAVVQLLLDKGVDLTATEDCGRPALHLAAQQGVRNIVGLLLDHPANIHATDEEGRTALHIAVKNGRKNVMKLLLNRNADIHATNEDGRTALHFAAEYDGVDMVRMLRKLGDDPKTRDNHGKRAIDLLRSLEHTELVDLFIHPPSEDD